MGEKFTCGDFHYGLKRAMEVNHPLRKWRNDHKLTLAVLASEMGVEPSHLSEIERGNNKPSVSLTRKLSARTGIPAPSLLPDLEGMLDSERAAE